MLNTRSNSPKKPLFEFGTSEDFDDQASAIQGNLSIDFKKMFYSWFMFLPPAMRMERINLNNTTHNLCKNLNLQTNVNDRRKHNTNKRKHRKTLHIDLKKVDKLPWLTKPEKSQLKKLLFELKIDENKSKDEVKRKSLKQVHMISTSKQGNTNSIKSDSIPHSILKKPITKNKSPVYKIKKNKSLECNECRKCSENVIVNNMRLKRKPRIPATTITLSDQKLLESFIHVDKKSHGDPATSSPGRQDNNINTLFTDRKNIKIKTLELKYINPTYVVQYSSDVLESRDTRQSDKYDMSFISNLSNNPAQIFPAPVHTNHVVGMALTSGKNDGQPHISESPPERKNRDPPPSYLLPPEQRAGTSSLTGPHPEKKGSARITLTSCIRWCLCLSNGQRSQSTSTDIEEPMSKMDKAEYIKNPSATMEGDNSQYSPPKKERASIKATDQTKSRSVKFKSTVNINE